MVTAEMVKQLGDKVDGFTSRLDGFGSRLHEQGQRFDDFQERIADIEKALGGRGNMHRLLHGINTAAPLQEQGPELANIQLAEIREYIDNYGSPRLDHSRLIFLKATPVESFLRDYFEIKRGRLPKIFEDKGVKTVGDVLAISKESWWDHNNMGDTTWNILIKNLKELVNKVATSKRA